MEELKRYSFMKYRFVAAAISAILIIVSLGSLFTKGLNFGLDFTGGTLIEVGYEEPADVNEIRRTLTEEGYRDVVVQHFGSNTDVIIRMQQDTSLSATEAAELGDNVVETLRQSGEKVDLRRNEFVGPAVGEELREKGGLAMLLALAIVMVYIAFRFQFKFSIGAVVALAHDVIIVIGVFSLFQFDVDLTVLAAVLAVIGYSLNDTIVVSDRIRENFRKIRRDDVEYLVDISLTQTLGRTLVTSITTLVVLASLLVFGGELNFGFATALLVGVAVGTYSSIYVAANVLMAMRITREDLMPPAKEEQEEGVEEIPSWLKDD